MASVDLRFTSALVVLLSSCDFLAGAVRLSREETEQLCEYI
jgi:hypothetical protein